MARYERGDQFWQISQDGTILTIRHGKLGNKGRAATKYHPTAEAAQAQHDQLVLAKQKEGFRLADAALAPAPATAPVAADDEQGSALRAALGQDPEDAAAYAVYGDWLQRHGDPRGELIALQLAADALPKDGALAQRARTAVGRYLASHAAYLLGDLAAAVPDLRAPNLPPFIWRFGFIHQAKLLVDGPGGSAGETLAKLLAHPSGAFLAKLDVRTTDRDARAVVDELARAAPASLRELELFARADLGALDELWPALAHARDVSVTARSFEPGALALPAARRVRLQTINMTGATMASVARAPWPVLERLELRLCSRTGWTDADFVDVKPLLRRDDMPALTHLRLRGAPFAGAILRELTTAPLARQLQVLDLSAGTVSMPDLDALVKHAGAFPQLRELWLPYDAMTGRRRPELATLAKHVIGDDRAPLDTLDYDLEGRAVPRGEDRYGGIRE